METIRDRLWLWGTVPGALNAAYGFASRLTVAAGLRTLGLHRAMMCGFLPPTEEEYSAVAGCRELLWEMSFDDGFAFERPLAPVVALHRAHASVRGVLLDDFSTQEIRRGATPEVLARMRRVMPASLQLWAVIYSMSLDLPDLPDYLRYLDGISLWVWHGRDLGALEEHVGRCHALSGRTPLNLGMYFYDFGERRPLTVGQMAGQVDDGLRLVRSAEVQGLCFLSSSVMDEGLEAVEWTRRWIADRGDEAL